MGLRREMRRVLRQGKYDIVHVHSPLTPVLPLLAIDEADCPVVGTFHTYFDKSKGYRLFNGFFQKRLDMLSAAICVSHSTTVALERYFSAPWQIIPNGIDTDVFHPSVSAPSAIRKDPVPRKVRSAQWADHAHRIVPQGEGPSPAGAARGRG
jgi:glycosyltransferase involved in cell wall biosynthesis